jgi:hypothetical protein
VNIKQISSFQNIQNDQNKDKSALNDKDYDIEIIKDTYEPSPFNQKFKDLSYTAKWCVGQCDRCTCQSGPDCRKNLEVA